MKDTLFEDPEGPIEHFSWGRFVVCGQEHSKNGGKVGAGKDIRVVGTEVSAWKERKSQERRDHVLEPAMIAGVYGLGIEVLIIGTGATGALEFPEAVKKAIARNGIPKLRVERTQEACRRYNRLFHRGRRVALLAHGTC